MMTQKYGAVTTNNTSTMLTATTSVRVESATQSEGMGMCINNYISENDSTKYITCLFSSSSS